MSSSSNRAEKAWYHIVLTTYGAWLHGDPRGFRTRRHREHVEGDYKNPPPAGLYAAKHARSRASLIHAPVKLTKNWRPVIGMAIVEKLSQLGAQVLCCTVASQHAHVLVKIPRRNEKVWTAAAKRHAWHIANSHGWQEKLWARGCRAERIESRDHQLNVFRYIVRHAEQGAWVWKFK